ncbi:MAG TPA: class I adenylate-forming enzyme family protein [Thermoanaerobaculia bacterium]|nr:class I adenylate-forming enzyme family protein [Thermoanaerobaculia bacterium]
MWSCLERLARDGGLLAGAGGATPWRGVLERAEELRPELAGLVGGHGGSVGLRPGAPAETLAALATLRELGAAVALLPPGSPAEGLVEVELRPGAHPGAVAPILHGPPAVRPQGGTVTVFSSATTGPSRPHAWRWESLLARVRVPGPVRGGAWLSAYPLYTFAGLQALLHALEGAGSLVLLSPADSLDAAIRWSTRFRLAMATPTFWRRALLTGLPEPREGLTVERLSMGGEPATQDLLDRLGLAFPSARITHVYASSEQGSLFSVSDRQAGFPAGWIGRRLASGAALEIRDGELWVSSDPGKPFRPTGDLVALHGGRVSFEGRRNDVVNVGGRKVNLLRVETVLRSLPEIADVRTYPTASVVTGQLVAADLVLQTGRDPEAFRTALPGLLRNLLAPEERPRRIRFLDAIPVSPAGKVVRA